MLATIRQRLVPGRPRTDPALRTVILGLLALTPAACVDGGGAPPVSAPEIRPSDGLLGDPELQAVVDLQVARDTAGLVERLGHDRSDVRARSAFALGSVQAPGAREALVALLDDPDAGVRRDAAFALGQLGDSTLTGALEGALGDEDEDRVRLEIIRALGKIPDPRAAEALLSLEPRGDEEASRTLALARLGAVVGVEHEGAVEHLLAHIDDSDPEVRKNAAYYFGRREDPTPWASEIFRVREALSGYAKDDPAAMYLVQALGRRGGVLDLEHVRAWAVEGEDWRIRSNAIAAFAGREIQPEYATILLEALDDPSSQVSLTAASLLTRNPQLPSVLQVMKRYVEAYPDPRGATGPVILALARQNEREFVFDWMERHPLDDRTAWGYGLQALSFMAGGDVVERVARVAGSSDAEIAMAAVGSLQRRWATDRRDPTTHQAYFEIFGRILHSPHTQAVFSVAPLVGDSTFAEYGNVDTLMAAFRERDATGEVDPMIAMLGALGSSGDPEVEGFLRDALDHGERQVRLAAANAILRLTGEEVSAAEAGLTEPVEDAGASGSAPEPDADAVELSWNPDRIDWSYLAELGPQPRLVLETEVGRMVVRLVTESAPHTVQTMARLAESGRVDDTPFHRVVPNFVIQGGDFVRGDGRGQPGFSITSELTEMRYLRGVIGMASAGKDTENSQFFLVHSMTPHLEGSYTAFGWLEDGAETLDSVVAEDRLVRATVEPGG